MALSTKLLKKPYLRKITFGKIRNLATGLNTEHSDHKIPHFGAKRKSINIKCSFMIESINSKLSCIG